MYEFKLLEYFQTWIGVLASLLVLCIALGKENIHSQILKITKDRINNSLKIALDLMDSHVKSFPDISISLSNAKGGRHSHIITKIKMLMAERQQIINISLANTPMIQMERTNNLKCIENRFVTVTAPFYSLMSCILLFVLDGLGFSGWIGEKFIMTFLTLLLPMSVAYWIVLWRKDFTYLRHIIASGPLESIDKINKKWSNLIYGFVALFIMYFFIIFTSHVETNVTSGRILIFGFGLTLGLIGALFPMYSGLLKESNLPYGHSFLHSLFFFAYCGIVAWMLTDNAPWSKAIAPLLFEYSNTHSLILLWSLFILINGLIVPFFSTQYAFDKIGIQAMTHINEKKATLNADLKRIDGKIRMLADCQTFLDDIYNT